MQIWVDADATPNPVKSILYRAAERVGLSLTLVANQPLQVPSSAWIKAVRVGSGFDVADDYILQHACAGDLVITADIPLAAELVAKHCQVLSPRGEAFTAETVRQRLNMRDFLETMRASGLDTGGPPAYNQADRQAFANALDRILARARPDMQKPH
ncbi:YaiI/YqxD family protein [Halochromatium sp.]